MGVRTVSLLLLHVLLQVRGQWDVRDWTSWMNPEYQPRLVEWINQINQCECHESSWMRPLSLDRRCPNSRTSAEQPTFSSEARTKDSSKRPTTSSNRVWWLIHSIQSFQVSLFECLNDWIFARDLAFNGLRLHDPTFSRGLLFVLKYWRSPVLCEV